MDLGRLWKKVWEIDSPFNDFNQLMRASSELKNHVRHIQKQVDHWHRHQLSQSSSNRLTQIHTQGEEDKEDYMEFNELNQSRHEEDALYPRPESDIGGL